MTAHRRQHALLRPGIALPFLLVALIWGSTWFVIKDQLDQAPASWSASYRAVLAAAAMFALAAVQRHPLGMAGRAHLVALALGFFQFFCNFNFIYRAEVHLTSGIVAVLFALLMVPNAILARLFLGVPITPRFALGTLIAIGGIALLIAHESTTMPAGTSIGLGLAFALLGLLAASVSNVMQASNAAQGPSVVVLLAWALVWGTLFNVPFAYAVAGPPVIPREPLYWAGVGYLAVVGSVMAFPLYFRLIRDLGPGRAAYNGVLVPVIAMALSTLFEGYRWTALAIAGAVLAMIGLVVALRGRQLH